MAKGGGICVANHTTPIDVLILMCDRCYSLVSCYNLYSCLEKGFWKKRKSAHYNLEWYCGGLSSTLSPKTPLSEIVTI